MYVSLYSSSVITIIIYLLEMVIKNSSQYVYAVEQDKKAQSALTIALKTHTIHVIHVGLQCICTIMVQIQLQSETTTAKEIGLDIK